MKAHDSLLRSSIEDPSQKERGGTHRSESSQQVPRQTWLRFDIGVTRVFSIIYQTVEKFNMLDSGQGWVKPTIVG
jgi:hypothetical protein